jgi:hypothetical protein
MKAASATLLAIVCLAPLSAQAAPEKASPIAGAWIDQNLDCANMFVTKGGKQTFKKPVDLFAPAFIISGKRLMTPQASCKLLNVRQEGDRHLAKLSCANSVSVGDITLILARGADGTLVRYFDANDKSGSRYKLCTP